MLDIDWSFSDHAMCDLVGWGDNIPFTQVDFFLGIRMVVFVGIYWGIVVVFVGCLLFGCQKVPMWGEVWTFGSSKTMFLGTPPKFNSSPLKNDGTGRRSFPFGMVYFQGRTIKLQVGMQLWIVSSRFELPRDSSPAIWSFRFWQSQHSWKWKSSKKEDTSIQSNGISNSYVRLPEGNLGNMSFACSHHFQPSEASLSRVLGESSRLLGS